MISRGNPEINSGENLEMISRGNLEINSGGKSGDK